MLTKIKAFFDQHLTLGDNQTGTEQALRLAVGALLLEMSHMDGSVDDEELEVINHALRQSYDLNSEEAAELLALAQAEHAEAIDSYQFTSLINAHYSMEQRIQLIEMLWQIAYADQSLHKYEEHLLRRISDLLYVSHSAFIAAKHRVLKQGASETGS